MQSVQHYTVLITGGGSGIGRASAIKFASEGASKIYITGRRAQMLHETAEIIAEQTPDCQVICLQADLTIANDRARIVNEITSAGPLDVLINNAGVYSTQKFDEITDESLRSIMSVNLDAVFALTRDLLPALEASKRASVVNIGSTLSMRAIPQGVSYNIAKAAIDHLTRSLANELGPRGIRVNCVSPGITETEMYRGRYDSDEAYHAAIKQASEWHPLGRVGKPSDIAEAVLFLASPAASWITGVVLPVDGGLLTT